jgi:hypothetical protein
LPLLGRVLERQLGGNLLSEFNCDAKDTHASSVLLRSFARLKIRSSIDPAIVEELNNPTTPTTFARAVSKQKKQEKKKRRRTRKRQLRSRSHHDGITVRHGVHSVRVSNEFL